MTNLQWWQFYSSEAAHKAEFARNWLFSKEQRVAAQNESKWLYDAARKVREQLVSP